VRPIPRLRPNADPGGNVEINVYVDGNVYIDGSGTRRAGTEREEETMKRFLVTVFALLFATSALVAPAAWAQTPTPPAPPKADAPKPADPAKLKDAKKADADKDKKVEAKDKGKHKAKGQKKDDKATGLDRADQVAGPHGAEGRATAREKQGRK